MIRSAILAGAVSAEHTSLALFDEPEGKLRLLRSASVPSGEHAGLRAILRRFAGEDLPRLAALSLAVSGSPPWPLDAADLATAAGLAEADVFALEADGTAETPGERPEGQPATPLWRAARRAARRLHAVGRPPAHGGEP